MNRNKELAQLLGIPPVCKEYYWNCPASTGEVFKDNKTPELCEKCGCKNKYPDFTESENFVKLQQLIYTQCDNDLASVSDFDVEFVETSGNLQIDYVEGFIYAWHNYWVEHFKKSCIKQAQQIQWDY